MSSFDIYVDAISMISPSGDQPGNISKILQSGSIPSFVKDWRAAPTLINGRALRRLSPQTLLAIAVAEQMYRALDDNAAWVFSSAYSEGETLKVILESLCRDDLAVRPLRFQNSVHNAASGQWTIAAQITKPVTSICGGDATAVSGLLKAILQARLEDRSVGFVSFDMPLPFPLETSHRITLPAGIGLAVSPKLTVKSFARMTVSFETCDISPVSTVYGTLALETGNPVFKLLPLFERLTGLVSGRVALDMNGAVKLCLEVERL